MNRNFLFFALLLLLLPVSARAFDLYFLRHAQTMANVTREYTEENQQTFSRWGLDQVEQVTETLAEYEFDVVIVSPAWRTRHTILPVLQARSLKAEIWPEVYECCWDRNTEEEAPRVTHGDLIEIDPDLTRYFRLRSPDAAHMLEVDTPARGDLMVAEAVALLRERFEGSGLRVLVVSHYHTGGRLMRSLLGDAAPSRIQPQNARISHLRSDSQGGFELLLLNGEPQ